MGGTSVFVALVVAYLGFLCYAAWELSRVPVCMPGQNPAKCFPPLLGADDRVDLIVWSSTSGKTHGHRGNDVAAEVEQVLVAASNVNLHERIWMESDVAVPTSVRQGRATLYLHIALAKAHPDGASALAIKSNSNTDPEDQSDEEHDDQLHVGVVAETVARSCSHLVVQLTELAPARFQRTARALLGSDDADGNDNDNDIPQQKQQQEISGAAEECDVNTDEECAEPVTTTTTPTTTKGGKGTEQDEWPGPEPGQLMPHYRYLRSPVVIRYVDDQTVLGAPVNLHSVDRTGSMAYHRDPHTNQRLYLPTLLVDENALLRNWRVPLGPDSNRPPVPLRVNLTPVSILRRSWVLMLEMVMETLSTVLTDYEVDELRYLLSDDNVFRFALTQIVSFVHLGLDFMAFKNDIGFYVGRTDMGGVSASTIISQFVCSLVIFLYLYDGGGTSLVVLFSIGSGTLVEGWKMIKILKPRLVARFPFVAIRDISSLSQAEQSAEQHDVVARRYLWFVFGPLLVAYAGYCVHVYQYRSWFSWAISSMANAVYAFGFIALCPQLYINYKLKSVAHMPWRVFVYKIFNTFVDDLFAFIIEMPLKHRLMTLRDDVVFACYLYQAWIYRVDHSRPNEYGFVYEDPTDVVEATAEASKRERTEPAAVLGTDGNGSDDDSEDSDYVPPASGTDESSQSSASDHSDDGRDDGRVDGAGERGDGNDDDEKERGEE